MTDGAGPARPAGSAPARARAPRDVAPAGRARGDRRRPGAGRLPRRGGDPGRHAATGSRWRPSTATTTRPSTRSASARSRRGWRGTWGSPTAWWWLVRAGGAAARPRQDRDPGHDPAQARAAGDEEFEVVKTHAVLGARVLADANSEVLGVAEQIARSHHERWDGDGYPDGLAGEAIPLAGRLVASPTSSTCSSTSGPTRRPGRSRTRPGRSARRGHAVRSRRRRRVRRAGRRQLDGRTRVQLRDRASSPAGFRAITWSFGGAVIPRHPAFRSPRRPAPAAVAAATDEPPLRPPPGDGEGAWSRPTAGSAGRECASAAAPRELTAGGRIEVRPEHGNTRREGVGAGAGCANEEVAPSAAALPAVATRRCACSTASAPTPACRARPEPKLAEAATAFAQEIVDGRTSPTPARTGLTCERIERAGYIPRQGGWPSARTSPGAPARWPPQAIMKAWMQSQGTATTSSTPPTARSASASSRATRAGRTAPAPRYATTFGAIQGARSARRPRRRPGRRAGAASGRARPGPRGSAG